MKRCPSVYNGTCDNIICEYNSVINIHEDINSCANLFQMNNDFKNKHRSIGYSGPCPPTGSGKHKYVFQVYALNNIIPENTSIEECKMLLKKYKIAVGQIYATYERSV